MLVQAATPKPHPEALPATPSQGWVQDSPIPVSVTEGGVVLDLSAFLPDMIREIRRHGFDTDQQVLEKLRANGYATPHLSMGAAEKLTVDLAQALPQAEEAGTVPAPGTCGACNGGRSSCPECHGTGAWMFPVLP